MEHRNSEILFVPVNRSSDAFQQPLPLRQIRAACLKAFGRGSQIVSVTELNKGQHNNTYFIQVKNGEPVILRVAPSPKQCIFWHEKLLLRRELAMQPFLAPIAPLLPLVLYVDFTHQLMERDYVFTSYLPGTLGSEVMKDLSIGEHDTLWKEFGRVVKTISGIQGETFGLPEVGPKFSQWSLTVIDWLHRTLVDAQNTQLDATHLRRLLDIARDNSRVFDEIGRPRLLHGDLWWFNLLVERKETGPHIVGVLDADRGSWGDPMADWTFFLLSQRATPQERTLFWEGYGQGEQSGGSHVRSLVYAGLHQGKILSVARRDRNERVVAKAGEALVKIVTDLEAFV